MSPMEEENIVTPDTSTAKKPEGIFGYIWEILRFVLLAIIIVVPIRVYVAQPFVVSGASMDPTLANGEYLIIDEISYRLNEPERGDVIVFRYPKDTTKFFIKRIIGLPNETVEIKDGVVTIYNEENKNGLTLDESFLVNHSGGNSYLKLSSEEYFVMGDNRPASSDSRYWGPVPKDNITGRALVRLLPLKKISLFPGKIEQKINE
ncbi:MAG: signal peptidase I [Candidatus Pacebacteria bacterium]|nr:signal peptidase I [Candidatus Paceibacterota bacterium]